MRKNRTYTALILSVFAITLLAAPAGAEQKPRKPREMKKELHAVGLQRQKDIQQMRSKLNRQRIDTDTHTFTEYHNRELKAGTREEKQQIREDFKKLKTQNKEEMQQQIEQRAEEIEKESEAARMAIYQKYRMPYEPRKGSRQKQK